MLLKLVELRSSDWGRVRDAAAASNATPDNDPNYFMVSIRIFSAVPSVIIVCVFLFFSQFVFHFPSQNEPTFYTEDGTPFTAADPGEHTSGSANSCTSTNINTKKKNKDKLRNKNTIISVAPFYPNNAAENIQQRILRI